MRLISAFAAACLACLFTTPAMTSVGTLAAFGIVCLTVIWLRRTHPDIPRGYRVPLYPVLPALGILSCFALIFTVESRVLIFFAWYVVGAIVLYFVYGMVGIGAQVDRNAKEPPVAVVSTVQDYQRLEAARDRLAPLVAPNPIVELRYVKPDADLDSQRSRLLDDDGNPVIAVLDGGFGHPKLTGAVTGRGHTAREVNLIVDEARRMAVQPPLLSLPVELVPTTDTSGLKAFSRSMTGRIGQALLFVLTILLAGMLLSQLIEEKSSKVIEVLAAAVPIDAIFLGKLFAMMISRRNSEAISRVSE